LETAAAEEARRTAQEALSRATGPESEELAILQQELEVAEYRLQAAERAHRRRRD
jgi:hypothetical protein